MPCEAPRWCSAGCQKADHLPQIEEIDMIIGGNVLYSSSHYAQQVNDRNKFSVIPGWNRRVKHLYAKSRDDYQ